MMQNWIISKLEDKKYESIIIIEDNHKILNKTDHKLQKFIEENKYIAIFAATNLVFRELYIHALEDSKEKILLIDQTPQGRKNKISSKTSAPPLFYPDLMEQNFLKTKIIADVQQYLIEITNDTGWPKEAKGRKYAKLILENVDSILKAHDNLRKVDQKRFSDEDFQKIIAFSVLGMPNSVFSKLNPRELWKLGFVHHHKLNELEDLAPEILKIVKMELLKSEKPFCWLAEDPASTIKGFYLALILCQHYSNWDLLLANIDPNISKYREVSIDTLIKSANELMNLDTAQSDRDIGEIEESLSSNDLSYLLKEQINIFNYDEYKSIIKNEKYSTLFLSLSVLVALRDLLELKFSSNEYDEIYGYLFTSEEEKFLDKRESMQWSELKKIYKLTYNIQTIRKNLKTFLKILNVDKNSNWNFIKFWKEWNEKKIDSLEYYISILERNIEYEENILPRKIDDLPEEFIEVINNIKNKIKQISLDIEKDLNELNNIFINFIAQEYPKWISGHHDPTLTSEFVTKCLKPYWDPETEKAVIIIFDGMRYDIWNEFLRPILGGHLELIQELPASSILPTETHITRKAISAGTFPDQFDTNASENMLLEKSLQKELRYKHKIETVEPKGLATGETVRYQGQNLDVYIFELCDKTLHGIPIKRMEDRDIPSRPLDFIYEQIRNVFEKEVLGIIKRLSPGTKVFITSDHGFRKINRNKIWFKKDDLNSENDCSYLNCRLAVPLNQTEIPFRLQSNIVGFTPKEIRLPDKEIVTDRKTGSTITKTYSEIVFPIIEYAFERPGGYFNPDAWSHGGISLQEMIIPMVVLRVKEPESDLLKIQIDDTQKEFIEDREISFKVKIMSRSKTFKDEIRVDLEASINTESDRISLGNKIVFIEPWREQEITFNYSLDPEKISSEERLKGECGGQLTVTGRYFDGKNSRVKTQSLDFKILLNTERIIRRVGSLGNILGLTPKKSMRIGI